MPLTWADTPREILYQILELLKDDSKTMIQLQLTCKKWHLVAQAIMYRAICLPPAEDPRASLLMESLQLADKDYASKVMEIQLSKYSILDHNNLVQTIRLCPNIKCIEHDVNNQAIDNYYPILLRLYTQGYLRDLEKVSIPDFKRYCWYRRNDHKIKDYIHLILQLKESTKQLYVSFNHPRNGSMSLLPALKEFKQLEEIIFGESGGISFTQLDQVLRGEHPLLRKVTVSASNLIANGQDNPPIITALPHIRVLKLDLETCSTKDMQLVQLMFPVLQELSINTRKSNVSFDRVTDKDDQAKEEMEAFFGYASQTMAFDIGIGFLGTNSVRNMLHIASKQLQIFSVAINVTHSSFSVFKISSSYEGSKDQLTTHKEGKAVCHVRITMTANQVSENPCQSLLKVLAEDVNPRSIKIEDYEGTPTSASVFGNRIGYTLTQFKDLKTLRLSNMSLAMEASKSLAITKPLELEELGISNCKVSALFFEQLSRKISYIKTLIIDLTSVESNNLKGLCMPHTNLHILRLGKNFKSCKLSISLDAASTHLCFDADGLLKPATYYGDPNVSMYPICCISLSELETPTHRALLRSNNRCIEVFQQIKS